MVYVKAFQNNFPTNFASVLSQFRYVLSFRLPLLTFQIIFVILSIFSLFLIHLIPHKIMTAVVILTITYIVISTISFAVFQKLHIVISTISVVPFLTIYDIVILTTHLILISHRLLIFTLQPSKRFPLATKLINVLRFVCPSALQ